MRSRNASRLIAAALILTVSLISAWTHAQRTGTTADRTSRSTGTREQMRGITIPSRQATLAPAVRGIIAKMNVKEDDAVKADQALAVIDDRLQQAVVKGAQLRAKSETEIRQAQIAVKQAQEELALKEKARSEGGAAAWEVRLAQLALQHAQAQLDAAKEAKTLAEVNLELEKEKLEHYQLRAPFDGRILRVLVESGVSVTSEDKVITIVALDPLEAQLFVPLRLYAELKTGDRYVLNAGQPVNRRLLATVDRVDRIVDPASKTARVVFTIDNDDESLPAGFEVHLVGPADYTLTLPASTELQKGNTYRLRVKGSSITFDARLAKLTTEGEHHKATFAVVDLNAAPDIDAGVEFVGPAPS